MKRLVVLMIVVMGWMELPAQEYRMGNASQMPPTGILTGNVLEEDAGVPMEFVNLVLFREKDSTMVTGTVTDLQGKFRLAELPFGKFYLVVNFIGYEKKTLPEIIITPKAQAIDLGNITLRSATTNIEGVEIIADKQRVEYRIDKKVVNVSQDIMADGSSVVTALENVPSVQVDIEGNVSLRGSQSFTVLIDGRPSVLQGTDALQQIPASSVERLEIITNPSARYDPDGLAGIINVVMKKQQKAGYNGIINASAGTGHKYSTDVLLNYRAGKVNFFAGANYNNNQHKGEGNMRNESFAEDTTTIRLSDVKDKMHRNGWGVKGGVDYFLTEKTTLTFSGRYGEYGFGRDGWTHQHLFTDPLSTDTYTVSETESQRQGDFYEGSLNLYQMLKGEGHKLEAMLMYSSRLGDEWEEQYEFDSNSDYVIDDLFPSGILTTETGRSQNWRLKADYTKPFPNKTSLEAGYQFRLESDPEDYIYSEYDYDSDQWIPSDLYSTEMDFTEQIHSIYGTWSGELKSFGFQLGLRGEYNYRDIYSSGSDKTFLIDRFDLFPTVHISKKFTDKHQLLASYSRRVDRPRGWDLEPTITYMDPYNIRVGNPSLEPEFIDSYDLSYQYRFRKSFLSLEGYYRITKNKISRIRTLLDDGIIQHTSVNMDRDHAAGTELMANLELTDWFLINTSLNVYYYRLQGNVEGEDTDDETVSWDTRLNTTFKLPADIRLQLTANYRGPTITAQGSREGFFMTSLAVRKDLFQRKLSVTLSGRDLLKTAKRESVSEGEGFYSYDKFAREAPVFSLTLSYKINNYKQKQQRNSNGEEMEIETGGYEY
ncbi:MAG TPA: TonB-dependent receptor [Bacteroidales bacterium]|nr:TonB-dependent receptor [Bacteroidales bacterium]HNS46714.1 TonB-dependent receptor [Bacteroidales bacterium]